MGLFGQMKLAFSCETKATVGEIGRLVDNRETARPGRMEEQMQGNKKDKWLEVIRQRLCTK